MMETDVRDYLLADPDIAALVTDNATGEQRIFPMVSSSSVNSDIPAGNLGFNGLPAITYQRIHTQRIPLMEGASVLPHPLMQYNCHGSTALEAWGIADLLRKALDGFQGVMGSTDIDNIEFSDERDMGYEIGVRAYRRELDFRIFYSD